MTRRLLLVTAVGLLLVPVAWAQGQGRTTGRSTTDILNTRLPDIEFVDQPLEQVIDWLGDFMQINMVVRWQKLEDVGIDRDNPVSVKARNLRFNQILWLLMNDVGGTDVKLAYRASGPLLVLSTEEDLNQEMVTKVYDVADLLVRVPRASRQAAFDVTQGMGEQGGGGGGGGGGQGMFGEAGGRDQDQNYDEEEGGDQLQMDTLVELIQSTIEPDSWRENGGNGTIMPFQKLLVVHNTILVHQKLGGPVTEDEIAGP